MTSNGWVRLRQIALVARDLEAVVRQLGDELGLRVAHRDPALAAFGLLNAVLPLGTEFVEVVSPDRPGTAGGRHLERLGGDGGYMVIGHAGPTLTDFAAIRQRVDRLGVRVAFERTGGPGYQLLQLHPADTGGSFLEIDYQPGGDDPCGPWMPAGDGWTTHVCTDVVSAITGVEVQVPDPDVVAARWAALSACPLSGRTLAWSNATITFTDGTRGLAAVECTGRAEGTHTIAGVEFRVHSAP